MDVESDGQCLVFHSTKREQVLLIAFSPGNIIDSQTQMDIHQAEIIKKKLDSDYQKNSFILRKIG